MLSQFRKAKLSGKSRSDSGTFPARLEAAPFKPESRVFPQSLKLCPFTVF
jgi:hypothetical protein